MNIFHTCLLEANYNLEIQASVTGPVFAGRYMLSGVKYKGIIVEMKINLDSKSTVHLKLSRCSECLVACAEKHTLAQSQKVKQ